MMCKMYVIVFIFATIVGVQCQECGTLSPTGKPAWQAGIYTKLKVPRWKFSGSIISSTVIVTAGHLLYIPMSLVNVESPSSLVVAVGQLTWHLKDPVDENTQRSDVKSITLAPGFSQSGSGAIPYFTDDIAIIIASTTFIYNDFIRPVCLDFDYDFEIKQLNEGKKGTVTGWEKTPKNGRDPEMFVKELYFVTDYECIAHKHTNEFYADNRHFTLAIADKICVAANKTESAMCYGDSGAGIAFPSSVMGVNRYYLRGVLSSPLNIAKICTTESLYGFTSMRKHESFIRKFWNETSDVVPKQIGKCILPLTPEQGSYSTNVTHVLNRGEDFVLVTLTLTCKTGYGVEGAAAVSCYNGFWPDSFPKCVRMCQVTPHKSVEYRCVVSGAVVGSRACDSHEPIGTLISPLCRDNYYSHSLSFMTCKEDGSWSHVAKCSPDCGKVTPDGIGLVVGGKKSKKGEIPWHAGIYRTTTTPYMQICGGSLISASIIISAAHCFWTDLEKQLPASQFAVAVGKLYRPWNDKMDEAQKSDVKVIHLPKRYQGAGASFQDDIAVVIVEKPFEYKPFIRPVCLSFDANFDRLQLQTINKGKVAGWGLTSEDGKASPVLKAIDLPYVEVGTCLLDSPPDFREYITSDKICAGTLDTNSALCKGDSGGGLAFPSADRGIERYYLRGVVSTAPNNDHVCNTATYTTFTQIIKHEQFIKQYFTES